MEEAPENGKESPHSAHANGMNVQLTVWCAGWNEKKNTKCHINTVIPPDDGPGEVRNM